MESVPPTETIAGRTVFVDDGVIAEKDFYTRTVESYNDYQNTVPDYLEMPYVAGQFAWQTSAAAYTNLATYDVATLVNTTITDYLNKIKGFNLWRATACLKIVVNANPFQQGALILNFLPFVEATTRELTRNINLSSISMTPNIEYYAGEEAVTLKVPFVSPYSYVDRNPVATAGEFGKFYIYVLSPLLTGASGPTNVEVSAFFWLENLELAAPMLGNSADTDKEAKLMTKRPISRSLRVVSKVASALTDVPFISDYAKTTAWAAERLAGVAAAFGYSKPYTDSAAQIVSSQYNRYMATSTGPDNSWPLALIHNNEVRTITDISITNDDEMSLAFLRKVQMYLSKVTWATSDAVSASLYNYTFGISRLFVQGTQTGGGHTLTYHTAHPMNYLSRFCSYVRGNLKVRIKFVKTKLHTGRVMVVWTPNMVTTASITAANSTFALRHIIDLSESDEITLELPWMLTVPYIGKGDSYGQITILVLNTLRCPETCSPNVNVLFFWSCADNFEIAAPMESVSSVPCMIGNSDSLPSSVIGHSLKASYSLLQDEVCMGETISSIKQFLVRYNWLMLPTLGTVSNGIAINPHLFGGSEFALTGGSLASDFGGDLISYLAPMYAYARGSMRVGIYSSTAVPLIAYLAPTGAYVYEAVDASTPTNSAVALTNGTKPYGMIVSDEPKHFQSFQVPYYNGVRMYPTDIGASRTISGNYSLERPDTSLVVRGLTSMPTVFRAAADDFQLGYFMGPPPLTISYV